jgi:hypothetical protein
MKKHFVILLLIVAILCSIVGMSAQTQTGNRQSAGTEFWERRNSFIIAEIGISTDDAAKFIPLENEFKQKMLEVGRDCRTLSRESQNKQKMSDAEYMKLIDCYLDTRNKEVQLEKEYFERFKRILSPEKIYKYQEADAKFSRELVDMRRTAPTDRNNMDRSSDRNNPNRTQDRNTTNRPPAPRNNTVRPGNQR